MENWSPQKWIQKITETRSDQKEDSDAYIDRQELEEYGMDFSQIRTPIPSNVHFIPMRNGTSMPRAECERRAKEARERRKRMERNN